MPKINPERLLDDLKTLRTFGTFGTGVVRPSLSAIDMESRRWLAGSMEEAGLQVTIDGVGSVIGRSANPGPALLLGSHTDTQPRGGWLDGAMGVIYGLEVARACREDPTTRELAIDVASWIDEEGTYLGFFGSRSFLDKVTSAEISGVRNRDGGTLLEAIRAAGLEGRPPVRLEPDRYLGYLEAHIEQGGVLEETAKRIGVVTAIVGVRGFKIDFVGVQNHAGTTPMPLRRDAGVALVEFAHGLNTTFKELAGERTVWTMGHVDFDPGAQSIIPGRAQLTFQFRDPDETKLEELEAALEALVAEANTAGPCRVSLALTGHRVRPAAMDDGFQALIAEAAKKHAPGLWMHMPSGAGHDAQVLADAMPAAMLFVPSIGGVSHDFAEDTDEADIALGCQVFATAAAAILQQQPN